MPKLMGSDHTITCSTGANQEMSKKRRAALLRTAEDNEKPLDGGSKGKGRAKGDAKNVPKPRKVNRFWDEVPLTEDSVQAENFCDVIPDEATKCRAKTGDDADWEEANRKARLASREKRERAEAKRKKAEEDKEAAARIAPSSSSSSTAKKRPKPAPKAGDPKPKVDPGSSSRASESPPSRPPALASIGRCVRAVAWSHARARNHARTHGRRSTRRELEPEHRAAGQAPPPRGDGQRAAVGEGAPFPRGWGGASGEVRAAHDGLHQPDRVMTLAGWCCKNLCTSRMVLYKCFTLSGWCKTPTG